jgi:hypothetical protein
MYRMTLVCGFSASSPVDASLIKRALILSESGSLYSSTYNYSTCEKNRINELGTRKKGREMQILFQIYKQGRIKSRMKIYHTLTISS